MKSYIISHLSDSMLKPFNVVDFQLFLNPFFNFLLLFVPCFAHIFSATKKWLVQSLWSHTLSMDFTLRSSHWQWNQINYWKQKEFPRIIASGQFIHSAIVPFLHLTLLRFCHILYYLVPYFHTSGIRLVKLIGSKFYIKV